MIEKKDDEDTLFNIERKRVYSTFSKRDKNNKNKAMPSRFKIEEEKGNSIPKEDKPKVNISLASNLEENINRTQIPILKVEEIGSDGIPVISTQPAVSGDTEIWKYYVGIGQVWSAQIGVKYLFN